MTTEDKFNAAVNVIRSLPKNGSYQPSNDLMLRFYAYFKQATLGTCQGSRPPFWDVVSRAKYDAWKRLGDLSKNEAMTRYVDELHSIVETMSYSDKVANFLEAPTNELDGINFDDLELVAGDVLEKVRSQPNSPLASREGSPIPFLANLSPGQSEPDSEDEFIDTIDVPNHDQVNGVVVDVSEEIAKTVERLKLDVERLSNQVQTLERNPPSIPRKEMSIWQKYQTEIVAFLIVWPLVASYLVNRLIAPSRRRH